MKINTAEADYVSNNFYGQVHCKFTFQKAKETFKETPTMNNDTLKRLMYYNSIKHMMDLLREMMNMITMNFH